jgi:hypothetical protein
MKKLILTLALIVFSACGMSRPFPPTISSISGASAAMAYGAQQNGTYLSVYDLADAHLEWDVSNVVGAEGVRIVAAKDYTCTIEVASNTLYIINSKQNTAINGGRINPQENLKTIFQTSLNQFVMGNYYICVKALKMGQESPPSFPVTINLLQNQIAYLKADLTAAEEKEQDPYFSARPENQ